MKTNYFILRTISLKALLGVLVLTAASCSSYQNTSSNDGIYSSVPRDSNNKPVYSYNDGNVTQYKDGQNTGQNTMSYATYFNSLQNEYPTFTDVENYSSTGNDSIQQTQQPQSYTTYSSESYGGWGENPSNVNVNLYGGTGWYDPWWGAGWSIGVGFGWGYGYGGYYPYYGWGYPYYGWGYPYYGYAGYYPYGGGYYYHNSPAYYGTRSNSSYPAGRGNSSYTAGRNNSSIAGRSAVATARGGRSYNAAGRNYNAGRNYSTTSNARRFNSGTTVRSRGDVQYNNTGTSRNSYQNSSRTTRSDNYSPSSSNRSYSPNRTYSPSSSPSRNSGGFGGGRSGGGGGGRSGGSGGGGRRG